MLITEAIQTLRQHARDLISVELANEVVKAFPYEDPRMYTLVESLVEQRTAGADWATRAEIYETGEMVAVYRLAMNLAQILNPDYELGTTPYLGTGKTAEYYSNQGADALQAKLTEMVNWRPSDSAA